MNLILFTIEELDAGLPADDERIAHIVDVLGCGPGDRFDIGIIDGPRGKATMRRLDDGRAVFDYELGAEPRGLFPITLVVGMPRPQTARRLLREITSLGTARIWFAVTDRSERGYASSKLWSTGEYHRHVITGAEQAFCTRLPEIRRFLSLDEAIYAIESPASGAEDRLALDNYESEVGLATVRPNSGHTILALGAERGWTGRERDLLRQSGFTLAHLGDRVLRVETAAIAAVSVILAGSETRDTRHET